MWITYSATAREARVAIARATTLNCILKTEAVFLSGSFGLGWSMEWVSGDLKSEFKVLDQKSAW